MVIGITGGIGSGKSFLSRELVKRGYTVYDCDREAKRIVAQDPVVQRKIMDLLGEESFVNGIYNTAYVAQKVFGNKVLLAQLNAIIHPAVKADIIRHSPLSGSAASPLINPPFLFLESAILFESGFDTLCDRIIVVDAPEEIRIARVIARDFHGLNTTANIEKVRARIRTQHPHTGDLQINNDGLTSIESLADQILNYLSAQL